MRGLGKVKSTQASGNEIMDALLQKPTNVFPKFSIFWAGDGRNQSCNLCVKLLRSLTLNWLKTESPVLAVEDFDKMQRHHEQTLDRGVREDQNLQKHTLKKEEKLLHKTQPQ